MGVGFFVFFGIGFRGVLGHGSAPPASSPLRGLSADPPTGFRGLAWHG